MSQSSTVPLLVRDSRFEGDSTEPQLSKAYFKFSGVRS